MKEINLEKKTQTDEFALDDIKHGTVSAVFDQREKYLIVALTGKVGSGCSEVAGLLNDNTGKLDLAQFSPDIKGFNSDKEREMRNILQFYRYHAKTFHLIRARDVIVTYLFESIETWNWFVNSNCEGKKPGDVWKRCWEKVDNKNNLSGDINNIIELVTLLSNGSRDDLKDGNLYIFIKYQLPLIAEEIHAILGQNYTTIFQDYGNKLRFFGTLDINGDNVDSLISNRRKSFIAREEYRKESLKSKAEQNIVQEKEPIEMSEEMREWLLSEPASNTMFTIAARINTFIKILQRDVKSEKREKQVKNGLLVNNDNKDVDSAKVPVAIVIDSMKNSFESSYLKDRYSAYYLISVSKNEPLRKSNLMDKKGYSLEDISEIDYNERPSQVRKLLKKSASILIDNQKIFHFNNDIISYLKEIVNKNNNYLYRKMLDYFKNNEMRKSFHEGRNIEINSDVKNAFSEKGIPSILVGYLIKLLLDPFRVFLYFSGLYLFYLQDVETCIQNADIFLANNETDGGKHNLKINVMRYISLMMHPGLVPPSPIERCMQIAYSAKVNSGCVSRQVGAVVTDSDYQILSLGWNDVPCTQTPCVLRNLRDIADYRDQKAYSEYELDKHESFQSYISRYKFTAKKMIKLLEGLPCCYCFKDIHEKIINSSNPMDARSMHGEEKALLLCDQQRVKGGFLFTTSSPCEMCAKNAKEHRIKRIYYIEPYPGISQTHVCNSGEDSNRAMYELFQGAIGRAYTQLYTPIMPYKDELALRGVPHAFTVCDYENKSEEGKEQ